MVSFLTKAGLVKMVAEKTTDLSEISKLTKGDIIAYSHPTQGYTHLALYLGDNKISSHTISRFGEDWDLGRTEKFSWTMLHFV